MKKTSFRWRYFGLMIVVIGAIIVVKTYFFSAPPTVNYITATAEKGALEQVVLADGVIQAFKQVSVGAQASGQIKQLYVELGDTVIKGQLIATINDLTQKNDIKQTEAELSVIQAQRIAKLALVKNNQLTFERQARLLAKGVGSQSDYDIALANLDSSKAEVDALDAQLIKAEIAVSTAKLNLGYTEITSPIDGVVVAIPVEEGQTVNAVQSAPTIIKVAQLDKITVKARISEADIPKVNVGMPVYFTILGASENYYHSVLRAIEPAPESINGESGTSTSSAIYYNGLFDVENPSGELRISMTTQVYIVLAKVEEGIVIPASALNNLKSDKSALVRVVDEQGNISNKAVTVGINNNVNVEITTGLKVGDKVIVSEIGPDTQMQSSVSVGM